MDLWLEAVTIPSYADRDVERRMKELRDRANEAETLATGLQVARKEERERERIEAGER